MNFFTGHLHRTKAKRHAARPDIAWLYIKAETTDTLEAEEGSPACVLLTEPILHGYSSDCKVKNVKFIVTSNDQGWPTGNNPEGVLHSLLA